MTDTRENDVEYWMERIRRKRLTAGEYLKLLENFVKSGEQPEIEADVLTDYPWQMYDDPILRYIVEVTHDPMIQSRVLTSKMAGKIFYESMGRFVIDCLHEEQFCNQKSWSERNEMGKTCEWSLQKKKDNWQSLIAAIDEKHKEDGFDKKFMKKLFQRQGWRNEANWEKLRQEWAGALERQMQREVGEKVRKRAPATRNGMMNMMERMSEQHHRPDNDDDALRGQAWDLMEGMFTESEFEKKLNIVKIQNKYPEIGEVARRMGRTVEEEGHDYIAVQEGFRFKIDHSAGSDIEGITVGNDINALLPIELTQYVDEQLEDLFYKKFLTRRLQTFRYRSELNKPSRKLHQQRAVRRGPMIVCLDSSASMYGVPQKIEASLLAKLEQTAEELKRDCFLIDFSVSIRPIDLRARSRKRRMERIGLKTEKDSELVLGEFPFIGGGTDAEKMLRLTFALLDDGDNHYMNADVLWVTDFLIPRTTEELMQQFSEYKKYGTRFYGFQIGVGENNWQQYFDHIYQIHYVRPRMY
ncbi:MAG: kinase [Prevotella sp.]|nr:kinase [Prevotella sp.]